MSKVSAEDVVKTRKQESGLRAPYVDPLLKGSSHSMRQNCRRLEDCGLIEYKTEYKEMVGAVPSRCGRRTASSGW